MVIIDHITLVVNDVKQAKTFFGLFGFVDEKTVTLSNSVFSEYLGVKDIHAQHHTLVLKGAKPRFEIQLLKYLDVDVPLTTPTEAKAQGFHHLCLAVEDIEETIQMCLKNGVKLKNNLMIFNDRKLVFLEGPANVTIELAQWL